MPTTKSIHGMWNLDQQYRYPLLFTYQAKNVAGRLKRSAERDSILYAYFLWTLVLKCSSLGWGGKKNVKISHFFLVLLTLNRIEAAICFFAALIRTPKCIVYHIDHAMSELTRGLHEFVKLFLNHGWASDFLFLSSWCFWLLKKACTAQVCFLKSKDYKIVLEFARKRID